MRWISLWFRANDFPPKMKQRSNRILAGKKIQLEGFRFLAGKRSNWKVFDFWREAKIQLEGFRFFGTKYGSNWKVFDIIWRERKIQLEVAKWREAKNTVAKMAGRKNTNMQHQHRHNKQKQKRASDHEVRPSSRSPSRRRSKGRMLEFTRRL